MTVLSAIYRVAYSNDGLKWNGVCGVQLYDYMLRNQFVHSYVRLLALPEEWRNFRY